MIFRNRITVLLFVVIIGVIVIGCNIGNNLSDSTNVTIDLGNPKVLGVSSVMVTISGEGMDTITKEFTYDTPTDTTWTIKIEVPQGSSRKFEVTANVSNSINAILGYYGSSTADISEENKTVTVHMGISRMKIITPNPWVSPQAGEEEASLVVMDNMEGGGWKRIKSGDLGWVSTFRPWDIDVDQFGNIIVVNNGYSTGEGVVWKLTSLSPLTWSIVYTASVPSLVAVTVDRNNSKIYYVSEDDSGATPVFNLYSCSYTPLTGSAELITSDYISVRGLAVDESGILYIASDDSIVKFNPEEKTEIESIDIGGSTQAIVEDVMVKGDYIYVADSANKQIVRLNKSDLSGAISYSGPTGGLYGPRRFVATLNNGICFIDEADSTDDDRLVYIEDINGNGYKVYGSYGYNEGHFSFFYGSEEGGF